MLNSVFFGLPGHVSEQVSFCRIVPYPFSYRIGTCWLIMRKDHAIAHQGFCQIQDVAVVSDGSFCWRKWSICPDQHDDAALVHVAQAEKNV